VIPRDTQLLMDWWFCVTVGGGIGFLWGFAGAMYFAEWLKSILPGGK
jgi:hypothetical protein